LRIEIYHHLEINSMYTKISVLSALVILVISVSACQTENAVPSSTEAVQEDIIPTDTSAPTPIPLTVSFSSPQWQDVQANSICLEIMEGHDYENSIEFLNPVYLQEKTASVLREIGFKVINDAATCDATLHITAATFISYSTYTATNGGSGSFDCLTDVGFLGLMILTTEGHPPLYADFKDEVVDEPYTVINGCSEINAAVDVAWMKAVLKGLDHFMGSYMLTSLFKSDDNIHRTAALGVSEVLGPKDLAALPDLVEALKTNPGDSSYIAAGIQKMGPSAQQAAQEAVPTLLEILKASYDDDVTRGFNLNIEFQQDIIEALGKLGPGAKEAVPLLIQLLQDQDPIATGLHDSVVQALGNIGTGAVEAVPELKKIVDVNIYAADALEQIEPITPQVIATLMNEAKEYKTNPVTASLAMETLGKLNAQSSDILPFLISTTTDTDPNVAANAIRELGKLGPISPEILPVLKKALSSSNETIQQGGASAVADFGPDAAETIPLLIALIKNSGQYSLAKSEAVRALGELGQASPEVVSTLIGALESYTGGAELALEQLGPEARAAVPALINGLAGENINPYYYETQTPYVRALIAITGEYHGYQATNWQAWWDTQPK